MQAGCTVIGAVDPRDQRLVGYCALIIQEKSLNRRLVKAVFQGRFNQEIAQLWHHLSSREVIRLSLNSLLFSGFSRTTQATTPGGRILSFAVLPEYQGQGIGSRLLQEAVQLSDQTGQTTLNLEVRPTNTSGLHLYQRHGFQVIGKTRDLQGQWLIMVRYRVPRR